MLPKNMDPTPKKMIKGVGTVTLFMSVMWTSYARLLYPDNQIWIAVLVGTLLLGGICLALLLAWWMISKLLGTGLKALENVAGKQWWE
jgi:small neutral amino acid transporter SnatA (MarC family)